MLWCIASYIVSDASTGVVEIEYTTILEDLENVWKYAWGAAAWATMQRKLESGNLNGMSCALLVYLIFFYFVPFWVGTLWFSTYDNVFHFSMAFYGIASRAATWFVSKIFWGGAYCGIVSTNFFIFDTVDKWL